MKASIEDINAGLEPRIASLAVALLGEPSDRRGSTWRWGRKGSIAIVVDGAKRGAWCDHEAGVGGDPLGLVAHARRCPMAEAVAWARDWNGDAPPEPRKPAPVPRASDNADTRSPARRCWQEAGPAAGSLVEAYLASRGLSLPAGAPLRFHPRCQRGAGADAQHLPAMVALMTDPATGEACGVHRTFLRPDGSGKADGVAKMMLGNAGVVRLVPDAEVTLGLGLAEGIETALSVTQGFGWSPVWAATSAGAIAGFPVLPGISDLTIFADADAAGVNAAQACAAQWREAGRCVAILRSPAGDFNDLLKEAA
jgi:putative DNA primase/helicase